MRIWETSAAYLKLFMKYGGEATLNLNNEEEHPPWGKIARIKV